ncbi:MAG: hypothetical protein ACK5LK_04340 [Chthoniobacterales bacterium]
MFENIPFASSRAEIKKSGLQLHCVRVERTETSFEKDHSIIAELRLP